MRTRRSASKPSVGESIDVSHLRITEDFRDEPTTRVRVTPSGFALEATKPPLWLALVWFGAYPATLLFVTRGSPIAAFREDMVMFIAAFCVPYLLMSYAYFSWFYWPYKRQRAKGPYLTFSAADGWIDARGRMVDTDDMLALIYVRCFRPDSTQFSRHPKSDKSASWFGQLHGVYNRIDTTGKPLFVYIDSRQEEHVLLDFAKRVADRQSIPLIECMETEGGEVKRK